MNAYNIGMILGYIIGLFLLYYFIKLLFKKIKNKVLRIPIWIFVILTVLAQIRLIYRLLIN